MNTTPSVNTPDPFYSERNLAELKKRATEMADAKNSVITTADELQKSRR